MRYKISLTSVYSLLKSRHISPLKEGKTSYITADQLQLMSELNTHLKNGGKVADFISARIESGEIASEPPIPASTEAIALAQLLLGRSSVSEVPLTVPFHPSPIEKKNFAPECGTASGLQLASESNAVLWGGQRLVPVRTPPLLSNYVKAVVQGEGDPLDSEREAWFFHNFWRAIWLEVLRTPLKILSLYRAWVKRNR